MFADIRCACPHGTQLKCRTTVLTAGNFGAPMNAANKGTGSLEKFWRPGRKEGEVEVRRRQDPSRALGLSSCFDMLSFTPEPQAKLRKVFVRVGQLTLQLTPGSCNIRPFHWGFRGRTRSSLPPPPKPPSLPRPQPTGTEVIVVVNSTRRRRPSFRLSPLPSLVREATARQGS